MISSPLMSGEYQHLTPDYEAYIKRVVGMEAASGEAEDAEAR
jgi:hypothetical protein